LKTTPMPEVSSLDRFIHGDLPSLPSRSPGGTSHLARPFCFPEIERLPEVVRRYFHAALLDGHAGIQTARVVQTGELRLRLDSDTWQPFKAVEEFATQEHGFVWDAHIRVARGFRVHVIDALRAGRARMRATALFGLIRVASADDSPELRAGALQRYLAEAPLCPTALLPRHGVVWSARLGGANASLSLGSTTVSLDFTFGADGLISSVYTPARAREMNGTFVETPWRGQWCDYQQHEGLMIPRYGQAEWVLADGPQAYWRGRMREVAFQYF
jgi:hypothetical protein